MKSFVHYLTPIEWIIGTLILLAISVLIGVIKKEKGKAYWKENITYAIVASILWWILSQLLALFVYSGGTQEDIIEKDHFAYLISFCLIFLGLSALQIFTSSKSEKQNRVKIASIITLTFFITFIFLTPIHFYANMDESVKYEYHTLSVKYDDFPTNVTGIIGEPDIIYSTIKFGKEVNYSTESNFAFTKDISEDLYTKFGNSILQISHSNVVYSFSLEYQCSNQSITILDDDNEINGTFTYSSNSGYDLTIDSEDEEAIQHVYHGTEYMVIALTNGQKIDIRTNDVYL